MMLFNSALRGDRPDKQHSPKFRVDKGHRQATAKTLATPTGYNKVYIASDLGGKGLFCFFFFFSRQTTLHTSSLPFIRELGPAGP